MFTRRRLMSGLGAAALAGPVLAEVAPAAPPVLIIQSSLDLDNRMTIPVMINGQGPFRFVVDTGADRTVIATDVAARLSLESGPEVLVHSIAGAQLTPTGRVNRLAFGDVKMTGALLPVLPRALLGVDGLLGVDALHNRRVVMDFQKNELRVSRPMTNFSRVVSPNEAVVTAHEQFNRLTVIDTRVDGVRATSFLDSGGGVSIGNLALAAALRKRLSNSPETQARLIGVTGQSVMGVARTISTLRISDRVRLDGVPMVFCDLHLFNMWGLRDKPTMLIGSDLLRAFSKVELDFGASRVLFRMGARPELAPSMVAQLGAYRPAG